MISVIDCDSEKCGNIATLLDDLGCNNQRIKMDEITDEVVETSTALIISGNPILITDSDPDNFLPHFEFIKSTDKPVLGICFGHQVIGMLYGASIKLDKEDREEREIDLIVKDQLFDGIERPVIFREDHCEEVSMPSNFVRLARSAYCPNEAMRHSSKPIYGVQFHPEVSGENGKTLLSNFIRLRR